jgi:hypothetical protein
MGKGTVGISYGVQVMKKTVKEIGQEMNGI